MKHFLLSLLAAVFFAAAVGTAEAQLPRMFSYQGVVLDGTGHFITDGPHNILISLYDALDASSPIYTENQTGIVFIKGIFNVMIGRITTIPNTIAFDKGYFLGVSIDGGTEMSPRTALSPAPYAFHASIADALAPNATGVVSSINGQGGVVTLQGGGGTTITNTGSAFTISSSGGGGTGIQGVQNSDGSLTITNPNGPTATISVANGGITSSKIAANAVGYVQIAGNAVGTASIADGAVTPVKLSTAGSINGQVLVSNGTTVSWQNQIGGGLTLPYTQSLTSAATVFSITNLGVASSGYFEIQNALSSNPALEGKSSGTGQGVYGANTGTGTAILGQAFGSGHAGNFVVSLATNASSALDASTIGTGRAGFFQVVNAASSANALEATTTGSGNAVAGTGAASGAAGVYGTTTSATGVGVFGETSAGGAGVTTNSGVCGSTSSGTGVAGNASSGTGTKGYSSTTGIGIYGITGAGATTARAAVFEQNGSGTTGNVVEATCIGTGKAGFFQINNAGNTSTAFDAATNGTSNTSHAIVGTHSANAGLGVGVKGITNSTAGGTPVSSATGVWGEVTPAGPGAFSAGVRGINNGTAGNGVGVVGYHAGNGYGVFGTCAGAAGGVGVYAAAPAGSWALYSAGKFEVSVDNAIKPTTNTWTIASDARLKNVLRPFSDGLDVLLKINPIWYRYNGLAGLPTETENIGILAQDMKQIAPYTVGTAQVKLHPDDAQTSEILTYNSHAITYVTINAIKELNQKITDLQQRLDAMEQLLQANGIDPNANGPISHK